MRRVCWRRLTCLLAAGVTLTACPDGPVALSETTAPPATTAATTTTDAPDSSVGPTTPPEAITSAEPVGEESTTTVSASLTEDRPDGAGRAAADPIGIAEVLAARIVLPSDCPLPLDEAASLPNADRSYRSGIHQGIDFICEEPGRSAVAALDGRVVMAVGDYIDPSPEDRNAVLDIAAVAGDTPQWTLAMLYGNFVVVDHGVIDGVGHVATIYAHLEAIDDDVAVGSVVRSGDRLGEIGNRGTSTASSGGVRPRSIHLHWEIEIDGVFLGAGEDPSKTRAIYSTLFDTAP